MSADDKREVSSHHHHSPCRIDMIDNDDDDDDDDVKVEDEDIEDERVISDLRYIQSTDNKGAHLQSSHNILHAPLDEHQLIVRKGLLKQGKKKLFFVLSTNHLFVFTKESHFTRKRPPLRSLPSYELSALTSSSSSSSRKLTIATPFAKFIVKALHPNDASNWITSINSVAQKESNCTIRKRVFDEARLFLVHMRVLEVRNLPKKVSVSNAQFGVRVTQNANHFISTDRHNICTGLPTSDWAMNSINYATKFSHHNPPIWRDIISFAAVGDDHNFEFEVIMATPKAISIFAPQQLIGKCKIGLTDFNLRENSADTVPGFHRWIPIDSLSSPHLEAKHNFSLHVLAYVLPASCNHDLTLQSLDFLQTRKKYLMQTARMIDDALFTRSLSVLVTTFNVGNRVPTNNLSSLLDTSAEIVVVGAQECDYEPRGGHKSANEDWLDTIANTLGPQYSLLKQDSLWAIRLCVFVHANIATAVSSAKRRSVATGVGNLMGNKGGVAISFNVDHCSMCFVNCHLAAHQHKTTRRNQDLYEILKNIMFFSASTDVVHEFDHLFLMGDLNYRLAFGIQGREKSCSDAQFQHMLHLIRTRQFGLLFNSDQLRHEMKTQGILCGFKEGNYDFEPSFKVFTDCLLDYDPKRSPAWCDRVLWKSRPSLKVEQEVLDIDKQITSSDHKPVFALFSIESFLLSVALNVHHTHIDMFISTIHLKMKPTDTVVVPSAVKLKSTCLATVDHKAWLKPPSFASKTPLVLRFTNIARLRQTPFLCEIAFSHDRIGFGRLCFEDLQPLHHHDGSTRAHQYEFSVLISVGGLLRATLHGQCELVWMTNDVEHEKNQT